MHEWNVSIALRSLLLFILLSDAISTKHVLFHFRIITEKERERAAQNINGIGDDGAVTPVASAPIGFLQAFMLPNVLSYAIAFGFFKLVSKLTQKLIIAFLM